MVCVSVDPAIPVLEELISCDYEAARTQIMVSGASSSCSQKIHNLQRGILNASQDSKYVLCLDDDVQLHPGFLQMAVEHMEADSAAFMLTGQLSSFLSSMGTESAAINDYIYRHTYNNYSIPSYSLHYVYVRVMAVRELLSVSVTTAAIQH